MGEYVFFYREICLLEKLLHRCLIYKSHILISILVREEDTLGS